MQLTHGSLFSGIGGFDLAAEWMGWENLFHCEWNSFGQKVLHNYWPNAEQFTDITKSDFTHYADRIDVLTGGFPCQPYSSAGKRKGKEDERHLWPQMLRAIREVRPRYIVGENVRGLVNWSNGLVFEEVQADLEAEGYQVQPFILPAAGVNAPHERYRIWFVAHSDSYTDGYIRRQDRKKDSIPPEYRQTVHTGELTGTITISKSVGQINGENENGNNTYMDMFRCEGRQNTGNYGKERQERNQFIERLFERNQWET